MGDERRSPSWIRMRQRMDSIRVRTTGAAVLVVGVALIAASAAMVILLERSLRANVRTTALVRAEAVAEDLATGGETSSITAGAASRLPLPWPLPGDANLSDNRSRASGDSSRSANPRISAGEAKVVRTGANRCRACAPRNVKGRSTSTASGTKSPIPHRRRREAHKTTRSSSWSAFLLIISRG